MREPEMIDCLERNLAKLRASGFDTALEDEFFFVGEWLMVFEGIFVGNRRYPGLLDPVEVAELDAYFGADMRELE